MRCICFGFKDNLPTSAETLTILRRVQRPFGEPFVSSKRHMSGINWPLSQDYNEAIQSPVTNFADYDLRGGQAVVNTLGIPLPCSGNFADVYQVRGSDGA